MRTRRINRLAGVTTALALTIGATTPAAAAEDRGNVSQQQNAAVSVANGTLSNEDESALREKMAQVGIDPDTTEKLLSKLEIKGFSSTASCMDPGRYNRGHAFC